MTNLHLHRGGSPADGEPRRDPRLAAFLRGLVGDIPMGDVDWDSLAGRVSAAIRSRQTPWWTWVERWQPRALPLAFAAGLLGASVLVHSWLTHPEALTSVPDMVSAVVAGAAPEDAATTFSHTVTSAAFYATDLLE